MEQQFTNSQAKMAMGTQSESSNVSDGPNQMRHSPIMPIDCNLNLLCQHIQIEGFQSGSFSDVTVDVMGTTFSLHRLILSRSSYFRNMLHGPWREAGSPVVVLQIDDKNVSTEAIAMALAYLYGIYPKLNDENAFRILAAASFLDLQDLCSICTDFIISELWTSNFLSYQMFAESQDYGIHGERVRAACWGYLCQSGAVELKEVLPKLSDQTLHALLTSDELWVPSEEKRFQLALYAFLSKGSSSAIEIPVNESAISEHRNSLSREPSHQFLHQDSNRNSCYDDQFLSSNSSLQEMNEPRSPLTYVENSSSTGSNRAEVADATIKSDPNHSWFTNDQCRQCTSIDSTSEKVLFNECGRCGISPLSWGGRIVGRKQVKAFGGGDYPNNGNEFDTFFSIFEGGSLLYCSMPFESLLYARKQLEELGFPAKSVNDGLWLQMLLTHRVQEIGADTCKLCCATSMECTCRQPYVFPQGTDYYVQENEQYNSQGNNGNAFAADPTQSQRTDHYRSVRVHVRCQVDGLAGIGRGTSSVPAAAWPPTRFVFSRVPFGMGSRNCQQTVGNDDSENRTDRNDVAGDGLTALAGLSLGGNTTIANKEQVDGAYEADPQSSLSGPPFAGPSSSGITVQVLRSSDCAVGADWDASDSSFIPLDMKTPLSQFPPFRFGVEFTDVHRLGDGQVKHSLEVFYAGSLWKVSVQAFNDEDPQGRRTLGLFLHRRKGEVIDSAKNVQMYVDSREKVKARYQLICPSKREVMVFGSFKQRGTLLPKAPKGWGWRTALLFHELPDILQNGALRIAAVVQLL